MSVRALCDSACRLGMDAGTARTLALYEGVLAADPDAQQVLSWAQAVADELQARTEAVSAAASAAAPSDTLDDGLWPHNDGDDAAEIARVMAQVAELDRRRQVVEALTDRARPASFSVLKEEGDEEERNEESELVTAADEFVASCELLQQVLRDVAVEAPREEAREDPSALLAEYLSAETAALDATRRHLSHALESGNGNSERGDALTEVERDAWLLQRAFTAGEVALLDAHVSHAEALSAAEDTNSSAAVGTVDETEVARAEAALQRLSEVMLPRALATAQRAETLPLLLADGTRRHRALAAQHRAAKRAADALSTACARVTLLAALCESGAQHARGLAEGLEHAGVAAAEAADSLGTLRDECAQMVSPECSNSDSGTTAFLRAAAALCVAAAHRTGTVLEPAPEPRGEPTVEQVAAWLACLRRQCGEVSPVVPLAPVLRRAGVELPLTTAGKTASGRGNTNSSGGTTEQLEALLAMAHELETQVHSLRAQVTGVLTREQHDARYRTQRTLWECFLHEPDKLLALVQPPSE